MSNPAQGRGVGFWRRGVSAILVTLLAVSALAACSRGGPVGAHVLVTIGEEELSYADFEAYLERNVDESEISLSSPVLSRLFDQFLAEYLLVQLALERGLDTETANQRMAVDFLIAAEGEQMVPDELVAGHYERKREEFMRPERVHLRQILVKDPKVAAEAQEAIAAGEEFSSVATRVSEEPRAEVGGDQGELSRDDLPPAIADVIFDLQPGEVSDIVAADYGYHLFQVVARHPAEVAPLEEVRGEIREKLLRRRVDELVAGWVKTAEERYDVEVYRNHFPFDYQGTHAERPAP